MFLSNQSSIAWCFYKRLFYILSKDTQETIFSTLTQHVLACRIEAVFKVYEKGHLLEWCCLEVRQAGQWGYWQYCYLQLCGIDSQAPDPQGSEPLPPHPLQINMLWDKAKRCPDKICVWDNLWDHVHTEHCIVYLILQTVCMLKYN